MRIAVVGGGIAGTLLAWRLSDRPARIAVELFTGNLPAGADATGASGGLVRGFEPDAGSCRLAAASLAEIRGSATLRAWSAYREVGSVYLLRPGADPADSVRIVNQHLPGSTTVSGPAELAEAHPFRDLPAGTVGVVERHAGSISPARLRDSVLGRLSAVGITVRHCRVAAVAPDPAVRLADGTTFEYDLVVVAAGAWTPRLLAAGGLSPGGLRTRQIQYDIRTARLPGLGAFVDEATGLYGRPVDQGTFLLGLPSSRWDVDPTTVGPDTTLSRQVVACARRTFGTSVPAGPARRTVASFDCYHDPPGLALRGCGPPGTALFTFTGGSGGAAKTVLAASRRAAGMLLDRAMPTHRPVWTGLERSA